MLLLLIGQIFLVGAIMKSDSVTYSDLEDYDTGLETLDMKTPEFSSDDLLLEQLEEEQMPEPDKCEDIQLESLIFRKEESYEIVDFNLDGQVKIFKRNQGEKLLRIRLMPAIESLSVQNVRELEKKFSKFSFYQSDRYSEMLFAANGRIGNPYVATDSAGLFRLSVPFQKHEKIFLLGTGEKVADGVSYYRDRTRINNSFADVHVLRIQPFTDKIKVLPVLANEGIAQKERLSSMVNRYNAVAAINGAYFTSRGDPIGTLIINRQLISSPLYDRSVFGVTDDDTMVFGNPEFDGTFKASDVSLKIDAVNQPRLADKLVVYTPEYARSSLTPAKGLELVLVRGRIVGIHRNDTLIPPDGVVVSASGVKAEALKHLRLGEKVELDYSVEKPWNLIKHAVCGGPRLVSDGKTDINGKEEKFSNSIVYGRHPRTAVAITFNGDLLFVVVDGRSKRSVGMKLEELASYLRKLGARHAINLDGGGSSSMIINGKTVNKPSDGGERRISNGILVTKR
jgi:exopolysaccharide biosynthesis protein